MSLMICDIPKINARQFLSTSTSSVVSLQLFVLRYRRLVCLNIYHEEILSHFSYMTIQKFTSQGR